MNIGEILSRAWKIIWKHKILWVFGILASCGQATGSSAGGGSGGSSSQGFFMPMHRIQSLRWMADIGDMEFAVIVLIIAASVAFALFMLMLVVSLSAIGRIGLVRGVLQAEAGQEKLSFGELLSGVKPFFWRIIGLNLLVAAAVFVLVLLSIPIFVIVTVFTLGLALLLIIPLLLLTLPLMWGVMVVVEQANVALIVEDISILDSLQRSWQVVKAHFGDYLVMGLILIPGLGLLGMLIIGLPALLVAAPFVVGWVINEGITLQAGTVASIVCFALYFPFLLVMMGILRSYILTAWTLSYLRLASPAPKAVEIQPAPKSATAPVQVAEAEKPDESIPDPLTGK